MKRLVLSLPLVFALTSPAHGQSLFESLARQAGGNVAGMAASALERGLANAQAQGGTDRTPSAAAAPAVADAPASTAAVASAPAPVAVASTGPSPWPNNLGDPRLRRPGQLKFDAALEAQKDAFKKFGEVSCNDCEGGVSFDTAAKLFLNLRDMWAFDSALGALEVGQSLTWRGRASVGKITAVSDAPVGPFQCKQLRWELKRGNETKTRDGLVCLGKSNPDADNERWLEVL